MSDPTIKSEPIAGRFIRQLAFKMSPLELWLFDLAAMPDPKPAAWREEARALSAPMGRAGA